MRCDTASSGRLLSYVTFRRLNKQTLPAELANGVWHCLQCVSRGDSPSDGSLKKNCAELAEDCWNTPEYKLDSNKINIQLTYTHPSVEALLRELESRPSFVLGFFFFLRTPTKFKAHQSYYWSAKLCSSSKIAVMRVQLNPRL